MALRLPKTRKLDETLTAHGYARQYSIYFLLGCTTGTSPVQDSQVYRMHAPRLPIKAVTSAIHLEEGNNIVRHTIEQPEYEA